MPVLSWAHSQYWQNPPPQPGGGAAGGYTGIHIKDVRSKSLMIEDAHWKLTADRRTYKNPAP